MKSKLFMTALAAVFAMAACSGDKNDESGRPEADAPWAPAKLTAVKGVPAAEIEAALRAALEKPTGPEKVDEERWGHTKRLYKAYGNQALWLSADGLHEDRAYALANAILQAEQDGLRMDAYPIGALARAMAGVSQTAKPTAQQLAETDVLLTAAFASLGEDYLTGQVDPKSVAQSWHIDPQEENVDSALVRSLRNSALDKSIAAMRPQTPDYDALRRELDRYQKIAVAGGWPSVPRGEPTKPGEPMSAARVAALKARLSAEGLLPATQPGTGTPASQAGQSVYDNQLAGAVAQFQSRHGIVVDSMLGTETFDALNKPAAYRAAQIAANLERMRWLPRSLGTRYVIVNVSGFHLEAYDNGQKTLEMKVIVGEDYE
ncbi:MAG TPA: peptidoglycan-binding protein, partial [Gemmatimonadaceae bacterium]|nr:peptidoglycan-binding protein [Gemmatimonadaceae bacterium]